MQKTFAPINGFILLQFVAQQNINLPIAKAVNDMYERAGGTGNT